MKKHDEVSRSRTGGPILGRSWRTARRLAVPLLALALAGCSQRGFRLFHPQGPVAAASWKFTLIDVGIMLLIIIPTGVMIGFFLWRYRKGANARYDASWSHSTPLELAMWGIPLAIVGLLAYFSFQSVYETNPYDPTVLLARAEPGAIGKHAPAAKDPATKDPAAAAGDPSLKVEVITTDWNWIFVYPRQKIATIDDLVVPLGTNVRLRMTSATVVNDFFIPQLAPMMDVMPGMRTKDAFRSDHTGHYRGFSANFSGAGFAWMQFATRIVTHKHFADWVNSVRAGDKGGKVLLDYKKFLKLARPTVNVGAQPAYFSAVSPHLFATVYRAVKQGKVFPVPHDITEHMAHSRRYTSQSAGS